MNTPVQETFFSGERFEHHGILRKGTTWNKKIGIHFNTVAENGYNKGDVLKFLEDCPHGERGAELRWKAFVFYRSKTNFLYATAKRKIKTKKLGNVEEKRLVIRAKEKAEKNIADVETALRNAPPIFIRERESVPMENSFYQNGHTLRFFGRSDAADSNDQ